MAMTIDPETGKFMPYVSPAQKERQREWMAGRPPGRISLEDFRNSPFAVVGRGMGLGSKPVSTLGPLGRQPRKGQLGGPGQPTPGQMGRRPAPKNLWKDPSQPLSGKRAPTKRTGGQPAMGTRAGIGGKEGPFYGGKPMFSAASRAALPKGSSLASQMRRLQGGRTGGARTLLARGRLDPMSKMQMGQGGFPGRRQVSSFIGGGRR